MAESNLSVLRESLPDLFEDRRPPDAWEEFYIIPVDISEAEPFDPDTLEEPLYVDQSGEQIGRPPALDRDDPGSAFELIEESRAPRIEVRFPGSPNRDWGHDYYPPPDALAFYLPFHYHYPDLWGIYIVYEGLYALSRFLWLHSGRRLTPERAVLSARLFLYAHEAFHHNTESFATRLEVTHRRALYRRGFEDVYTRTYNTDDCLEEALANAYAYRRVESTLRRRGWKRKAVLAGLRAYILGSPPGYNQAMKYVDEKDYLDARNEFAELNHHASVGGAKVQLLWPLFSHAFNGIARINSRTNYLVHRHSRLVDQIDLYGRRISYKDLRKKLKRMVGLELRRRGKGSHEIYETEDGREVTLYHTVGDIPKGTLSSILAQAGIDMSVYDFLRS